MQLAAQASQNGHSEPGALSAWNLMINERCPLAGDTFKNLACHHFAAHPHLPYVMVAVSPNFSLIDAEKFAEHIGMKGFCHPNMLGVIQTIHYLFIRNLATGIQHLETCVPAVREFAGDREFAETFRIASADKSNYHHHRLVVQRLYEKRRWMECFQWSEIAMHYSPDPSILQIQASLLLKVRIAVEPHKKVAILDRIVKQDKANHQAAFELGLILLRGAKGVKANPQLAKDCFSLTHRPFPEYENDISALLRSLKLDDKPRAAPPIPEIDLLTQFLTTAPRELKPTPRELQDFLSIDNATPLRDAQRTEELLQRILEKEPNNPYALSRLGELYRQGADLVVPKDRAKALKFLLQAHDLSPNEPFTNSRLGLLFLEEGDKDTPQNLSNAERALRAAYEQDPTSLGTLIGLARLYLKGATQNHVFARLYLEAILAQDAKNSFALTKLAILIGFKTTDDVVRADELFRSSYLLDKKNIETLKKWAEFLIIRRGSLDLAKKLLAEALALSNEDVFCQSRMAEVLRLTSNQLPGNLAFAADMFRALLVKNEGYAYAEVRLGAIYLIGNESVPQNLEEAEKWLSLGYKHDPENVIGLSHYAELLRIKEDYLQARHFYELAYERDSEDPFTLSGLGLLYRMGGHGLQKDRYKGTDLLQKAFDRAPHSPLMKERFEAPSLVSTEAAKTDFVRTIGLVRSCIKANPKDPYPHNTLGELLVEHAKNGNQDLLREAEQCFISALEVKRDHRDALKNLAELYLKNEALFPGPKIVDQAIIHLRQAAGLLEKDYTESSHKERYLFDYAKTLALLGYALRKRKNEKTSDSEKAKEALQSSKKLLKKMVNKKPSEKAPKPSHADILELNNYYSLVLGCLGELYRTGGGLVRQSVKSAKKYTERSLHYNQGNVDAKVTHGYLLQAEGKEREAKIQFEQALHLQPNHQGAQHANLVEVLL